MMDDDHWILAERSVDRCLPDLDGYRPTGASLARPSTARRRSGPRERHEIDYYTPEVMATNRALQRVAVRGRVCRNHLAASSTAARASRPITRSAFLDEAGDYVLPDFGVLTGTTFHVCVPTMIAYGQPEFLQEFVPRVLAGEALVCQFFSEPSSGSDLAGARTRATKDGDQWVLNGQKIWSTYAHLSDWGFCLARTDWDVPKHRGLTWFAVPSNCARPHHPADPPDQRDVGVLRGLLR